MSEPTTIFPTEASDISCSLDADTFLWTSNRQIILAIFGVSLVIASVTVSANGVIITAIVRAYICGISSPSQGSRSKQGGSGGVIHRVRLGNDSSNIPIVLMLSMAVTDTLLGAIIMPLYTIEILYYGQWPLGNISCKVRMFLDIVLSVSSIYHVTCMAIDRYLAICRPFLHQKLSVWSGVVAVVLCWAAPVAITLLFHVPEESGTRVVNVAYPVCSVAESTDATYNDLNLEKNIEVLGHEAQVPEILVCVQKFSPIFHAITLTMNFYIPFIAIVIFYSLILLEIYNLSRRRLRLKGRPQNEQAGNTTVQNTSKDNYENLAKTKSDLKRSVSVQNPNAMTRLNTSSHDTEPIKCISNPSISQTNQHISPTGRKDTENIHITSDPASPIATHEANDVKHQITRTKSRKSMSRSVKAAKTVSLVVACFLLCWLPFSAYILFCTATSDQGPYEVMMFILWLGYLNSCLNPLLYCGHVTIKAALADLFRGKSATQKSRCQ
ncbi:5-HT4 receptor [Elysia marginata]|uniref:5-HT4 receptor n=1 Tax=Elysia marginata TaxID=1093978 RepID=A0AAV4JFX7_9GAST|nr:5-HT4 receptor [Elysia marginata]